MSSPDYQPLTRAQQGIWFAQERNPDFTGFQTGEYIEINGTLNASVLAEALTRMVSECASLHGVFRQRDGLPEQALQMRAASVEQLDMRTEPDPGQAARQWMRSRLQQRADLEQGPLFSQAVIRLDEQRWFWFQSVHHIAIDAFSLGLMRRRVSDIYNAIMSGASIPVADFQSPQAVLDNENSYYQSGKCSKDAEKLQALFADKPESGSLAGRAADAASQPLRHHCEISQQQFAGWQSRASELGLTWPEFVIGGISAFLARMMNREEVIPGIPLMGRMGSGNLKAVAMLVNILPLRLDLESQTTLDGYFQQVSQRLRVIRSCQRYRYEDLQRDLGLVGSGRSLFGAQINVMPFVDDLPFGAASGQVFNLAAGPVDDLSFYIYPRAGQYWLDLDANPNLYDNSQLTTLSDRLLVFLERLAQMDVRRPVSEVSLLLPGEYERLTEQFNRTTYPVPHTTLAQLLARQVERTPQQEAVVFSGTALSYQQLDHRANQLARLLIEQGIGPGSRVAVAIPRSLELILALQAVTRAGAAYLPVDTEYPQDRIDYMLSDAQPALVLSVTGEMATVTGHRLDLDSATLRQHLHRFSTAAVTDNERTVALQPEHPAYIIYTSGSTGKPKGVVVPHQAIVNRLLWMQHEYSLTSTDRVLQKTPASFDVSVWEFYWPLITGATLVVAEPGDHRDPARLAQLIGAQTISTLHFVPSMLQAFLQSGLADGCRSIRQVFCSGEALPAELVKRYYQSLQAPLHNLYGPTEAAVDVSYWPCVAGNELTTVPIGRPIHNVSLYVLDNALHPLPPGVTGELYIGGMGLADGYFQKPELTAEKFVASPFHTGQRIYRTGDLARWTEAGVLEYAGRTDHQVKIRGLRIELGEIEAQLDQHATVSQSLVQARISPAGEQVLVAFVQFDESASADVKLLQRALSEVLPDYMVPSVWVSLAEWPVTPNGKLDRRALPEPDWSQSVGNDAPETLTQEIISRLFAELLKLPRIGIHDNFFELGGNSLQATRLIASIRDTLGVELPLGAAFDNPTPSALARSLYAGGEHQALDVLLPLRSQGDKPPVFCIHPAGGLSWCYAGLTRVLPADVPVYGVQARGLNGEQALPDTMLAMACDYVEQVRQVQPEGPYYLLGWSVGGMIAQNMAALLDSAGEDVAMLAVLDAYPSDQWRHLQAPGEQEAMTALLRIAGCEWPEDKPVNPDDVLALLKEEGSSLAALEHATLAAMVQVVMNNSALVRDSRHPQFSGNMQFFRAAEPRAEDWLDASGWRNYVTGTIAYQDISCTHGTMLQEASLKQIGASLRPLFEPVSPAARKKPASSYNEQEVECV